MEFRISRSTTPARLASEFLREPTDDEGLEGLLRTIRQYMPEMSLVTLTVALYHLAKLSGSAAEKAAPVIEDVLVLARVVLQKPAAAGLPCHLLGHLVRSLAHLCSPDSEFPDIIAMLVDRRIYDLDPPELVFILASLHSFVAAGNDALSALFRRAVDAIVVSTWKLDFQGLALAVWSYAMAGMFDRRLFRICATAIARWLRKKRVRKAEGNHITCTIWAYTAVGARDDRLLSELAAHVAKNCQGFDAEELVQITVALCDANAVHPDDYVAVARAVAGSHVKPSDFAKILRSLSSASKDGDEAQAVLKALLSP